MSVDYEEVYSYIGEIGRYQFCIYLLACVPAVIVAMQALNAVFLSDMPQMRCKLPIAGFEDTFENQSYNHTLLIEQYIPKAKPDSGDLYDRCKIFVYPNNVAANTTAGAPITKDCEEHVYQHDLFEKTAIEEFDIGCGLWDTIAKMLFFVGVLVGAIVLGTLSDRIGRKKVFLFSIFLASVCSIPCSFVTSLWLFILLKTLIGVGTSGLFLTLFVISLELVGPRYRTLAGMGGQYFWAIGTMFLALLGYSQRHWVWIQFWSSIFFPLFLLYAFIIPESPRWLLTNNKRDEMKKVLNTVARVNGKSFPDGFLDLITIEKVESLSPLALFKTRNMRIRTIIILFNWAVVSMTYYGLSLGVSMLEGDIFLNQLLNGVFEVVGYIIAQLMLDFIGRKVPHVLGMVSAGVFCIIFSVLVLIFNTQEILDRQMLFQVLFFGGKLGCSMGFSIIYIWSAEIFPTIVRTGGIGMASMCARIGGILAPLIGGASEAIESQWSKALPMLLFGLISIAAGVVSLILPETLGKPLPSSIQDGEKFSSRESFTMSYDLQTIGSESKVKPGVNFA